MSHEDLDVVADTVSKLVLALARHPHKRLAAECARLGLPEPPPEIDQGGQAVPKWRRLERVYQLLNPTDYLGVLRRFMADGGLPADDRYQAEELIWKREQHPRLVERTRRDIIEALEPHVPLWLNANGYLNLLRQLFVLQDALSVWGGDGGLEQDIIQHTINNPDDWTALELVSRLQALTTSDHRFALLLEGLLSSKVNPDEAKQRDLVAAITPALAQAGLKVIESDSDSGYPEFRIVEQSSGNRPAQLILFASTSTSTKPDLRLSQVLDRQVELVGSHGFLCYDEPVPIDTGLTWQILQTWWATRHQATDPAAAKESLWHRLRAGLPTTSPAQQRLFDCYYHWVGAQNLPDFPVLLPEVWLHWDPRSKADRGNLAVRTHRIDLMLLLPHHRRVILEVDGQTHYATDDGRPSPARYAQTMAADRDLRLAHYEVYRFGGAELSEQQAQSTANHFFNRLKSAG